MADRVDLVDIDEFLPAIVILFKNIADCMVDNKAAVLDDVGVSDAGRGNRVSRVHDSLMDMNTIIASVLHNFHLYHAQTILEDELGFSVLPRSIAWFSHFLLYEYNHYRWVQNF